MTATGNWKITKVTVSIWTQYTDGIRQIMLIQTDKENELTGEVRELFRMVGGFPVEMFEIVGDFEVWGGYESIARWLSRNGYCVDGCFPTETIQ